MEEAPPPRRDADGSREDSSPGRCYSSSENYRTTETKKDCTAESLYAAEHRDFEQRLWLSFQSTASAIAQLYREKAQGHEYDDMWISFQNAAEIATNMYKDSIEGCKVVSDLALQCGYQRRNKEILSWAKKRRRNIRREDLISLLRCHSPSPTKPHSLSQDGNRGDKMQTFHEAVSMNGLSGAMAEINFGPENSPLHQSSPRNDADLALLLAGEFQQQSGSSSGASSSRKRLSSAHLKSPSPKRKK
ncbi:HUWE1-associated protein modifying stress responses 1-like [Clavelina lepadiformis]|uniref:HUWE1-associated protein modifying stress responses 1-like n=1 Tax=Clavelina lepadiformis TaxID=159417 RepID=UPI0040423BB3